MAVGTSQFSPPEALGQAELVKGIVSEAVLWGPHLAQVGQVATHLVENTGLLIQTVMLQEVAEVSNTFLLGQLVEVQQALVDGHLHVEGKLHGLEAPLPTVTLWCRDAREENKATTLILQEHEHLGTGLAAV